MGWRYFFLGIVLTGIVASVAWEIRRPALTGPSSAAYGIESLRLQTRAKQLDGSTVFIGDSQVVAMAVSTMSQNAENFGIGSDTVAAAEERSRTYDLSRAGRIVIEIGINDLAGGQEKEFSARYKKLLTSLPNGISTVAMSIFPVRHLANGFPSPDASKIIRAANTDIKSICETMPTCRYFDAWPSLSDSNGNLNQSYAQPDGLHLTPNGYGAIRHALSRLILSDNSADK